MTTKDSWQNMNVEWVYVKNILIKQIPSVSPRDHTNNNVMNAEHWVCSLHKEMALDRDHPPSFEEIHKKSTAQGVEQDARRIRIYPNNK